jgi:hypothetical protein
LTLLEMIDVWPGPRAIRGLSEADLYRSVIESRIDMSPWCSDYYSRLAELEAKTAQRAELAKLLVGLPGGG